MMEGCFCAYRVADDREVDRDVVLAVSHDIFEPNVVRANVIHGQGRDFHVALHEPV